MLDRGELSVQGATSIFSFILVVALSFTPHATPLVPPSNRCRLPAFISPQRFHSYIHRDAYLFPASGRRSDSYIVSYSSVSARTDGKTAQWKRMIWSGGERSTLIKVASVLFFFLSFSVSLVDGFWQYFRRKTPTAHICLFWILLRNICGRGVIWKLYDFVIPLLLSWTKK